MNSRTKWTNAKKYTQLFYRSSVLYCNGVFHHTLSRAVLFLCVGEILAASMLMIFKNGASSDGVELAQWILKAKNTDRSDSHAAVLFLLLRMNDVAFNEILLIVQELRESP